MKHSPINSKASAGFTLVEVMVASLVMAAGVMGLIQVFSTGSQMVDTARKQAVAMQIIDSEIERLRSSDPTQLSSLFTSFAGTSPSYSASDTASVNASDHTKLYYSSSTPSSFRTIDAVVSIDATFTVQRTVSAVPVSSAVGAAMRSNFKEVKFKVSWTSNTGRTMSRTGSTFVGKDGVNVSYRR